MTRTIHSCMAALALTLSACGKTSSVSQPMEASPNASNEASHAVPDKFAALVGHEICSGKVTEEWVNPDTGSKVRQVWERRAQFVDLVKKEGGFAVGYKVAVNSQYFGQAADGTWTPTKDTKFDSLMMFYGIWSADLGRYVGYARWASQMRNGQAVDVELKAPYKVTSFAAKEDGLTMQYFLTLPSAATADSPANVAVYDETLVFKDSKLERTWAYKNYGFDPATLNPTTELSLGAQPSFDTEAKCSL